MSCSLRSHRSRICPCAADIAERAFRHERYHVDPRLNPELGDLRYGRWVRNSLGHPDQRLLKITDGDRLVALFLVESRDGPTAYWHLDGRITQLAGARLRLPGLAIDASLPTKPRAARP